MPDSEPTGSSPTDGPSAGGHGTAPSPGDTPGALSADEAAAARIAELLGLTTVAGTALAHLPTIAVVDEISGQLLALTTGAGLRAAAAAGKWLGPPPETPGYRPSRPLQRFVAARDRRCRFPGCRAPAIRCDLDHNMPWPLGSTSAENLCSLCRHHHRLSHQAPGWSMRRLPDGGLEWTTPGGDRITTHPPRYGTDDPPPSNGPPPKQVPQSTLEELVLGRPDPPGVESDPAPF